MQNMSSFAPRRRGAPIGVGLSPFTVERTCSVLAVTEVSVYVYRRSSNGYLKMSFT